MIEPYHTYREFATHYQEDIKTEIFILLNVMHRDNTPWYRKLFTATKPKRHRLELIPVDSIDKLHDGIEEATVTTEDGHTYRVPSERLYHYERY